MRETVGLIEIVRSFCQSLPALDDSATTTALRGVTGRGGFVPLLARWLQSSHEVFPEPVRVEAVESLSDRGVDVWLRGELSNASAGFQIKSENDVAQDDFTLRLKAQLTDARAYEGLELYVIVFACPPDKFMRIQYTLNEEILHWEHGKPGVLVLTPGRAASLYRRCQGEPLNANAREELLQARTWERFFEVSGQSQRRAEFLERWPGLLPDERFAQPAVWEEIETSLSKNLLTVIVGPPAVGKTYCAVQQLFRHFREGRPVRWIDPHRLPLPDIGLPALGTTPGLREQVRLLGRTLGIVSQHEPVDALEFVAVHLVPDSLVLIEDPFGQTEGDFSYSLHTYQYFDLNAFIDALSRSSRRSSARLLLTSRQGLFERCRQECLTSGQLLPPCHLIHLTADSYRFLGREWQNQPKVQLARTLIKTRNLAFADETEIQELATFIAGRCESPREIELVVDELSPSFSLDEVKGSIETMRGGALERTRIHCQTKDDAERLFLLGLTCFDAYRFKPHFTIAYGWIHNVFGLTENNLADEARCRVRFRSVYDALPAYRTILHKPIPTSPPVDEDEIKDLSDEDLEELLADEVVYASPDTIKDRIKRSEKVLIEGRDHLEPAHSTVRDATVDELRHHPEFCSRLILQLAATTPDDTDELREFNPAEARQHVMEHLLAYSDQVGDDAEKALAQWVIGELQRLHKDSGYPMIENRARLLGRVLTLWSQLALSTREAILSAVESHQNPAHSLCGSLVHHDDFPREDAWRFYRAMWHAIISKGSVPVGGLFTRSPFEFFLQHLDEAPPDLRFFLDWLADARDRVVILDVLTRYLSDQTADADAQSQFPFTVEEVSQIAQAERDGKSALLLAWLLVNACPFYWERLPENWKQAILRSPARDNLELQKYLCYSLSQPLINSTAPQDLLDLLHDNLEHPDAKMRAQTGMFVLIYWSLLSEREREALRERFRHETEIDVLLEILFEAAQKTKAWIELARLLLPRLN
ncbi:MAG: hypothetical protein M3347_02335, partial [Armatimonadota bacterium]|nr:hypothetical protein [Armatimonadota bacterium]